MTPQELREEEDFAKRMVDRHLLHGPNPRLREFSLLIGVVRDFIGHGIAEQFHTDLQIPHYDDPRATTVIEPGMTFTIEPMITMGAWQHEIWDDNWTAVTIDRKRTAQFEHTLLVTDDGVEILTTTG